METTLSTITVFPSDKLELEQYKRRLKSEILVNDRDPLAILKQLKFVEKTIADTLTDKEIDEHFLLEAEKYKEKSFDHLGCNFSVQDVGVKYDFDACGDVKLFDLYHQMDELKKKIKEREDYLKGLPYEGAVCPDNGNFLTRPVRSAKTKVVVKIK